MKKILLITDNAFTYSGREKICSYMGEVYGRENIVDVVSLKGQGDTFYTFPNVREIISLDGVKRKYKRLLELSNRYDYVYVLSMGKLSVFYQLAYFFKTKVKNKNKIYACEHVSIDSLSIGVKVLKYIFLRMYECVVVLTKKDEDRLKSWNINSVVIPNPIFNGCHVKTTRTYNAIAVGRLDKQKNFIELIKIWEMFVSGENVKYKLFIAGEGEEREALTNYIKKNNLSNTVILLGKVDDLESYYLGSDICLMTSLYEGLPLALLEAKSYGLPCIAYDCPTGPREIIENNIDGYVIDMSDKASFVSRISDLFNDNALYYRLSEGTKKVADKFSPEKIEKAWMDLLK